MYIRSRPRIHESMSTYMFIMSMKHYVFIGSMNTYMHVYTEYEYMLAGNMHGLFPAMNMQRFM